MQFGVGQKWKNWTIQMLFSFCPQYKRLSLKLFLSIDTKMHENSGLQQQLMVFVDVLLRQYVVGVFWFRHRPTDIFWLSVTDLYRLGLIFFSMTVQGRLNGGWRMSQSVMWLWGVFCSVCIFLNKKCTST